MSTATAPRLQPAPARPKLRLLPAPAAVRRPSGRSIAIALGLMLVAFVVQLVLVNLKIHDAYLVNSLEEQRLELEREHHAVLEAADTAASPQNLAQQATKLGMVPGTGNAYLDLASGSIVAQQDPAHAKPSAPIDPAVVPNSLLPSAEKPSADDPKAPKPGASDAPKPKPAVPSEFEITSPSTH